MKIRKKSGFTLIEMMIVIAILGLVMAILLPRMITARYRAHYSACMMNERSIATALESYRTAEADHRYPQTLAPLYEEKYLPSTSPSNSQTWLRCPSNSYPYGPNGELYTELTYQCDSLGEIFTISCPGIHSYVLSVKVGFPKYNNARGTFLEDSK